MYIFSESSAPVAHVPFLVILNVPKSSTQQFRFARTHFQFYLYIKARSQFVNQVRLSKSGGNQGQHHRSKRRSSCTISSNIGIVGGCVVPVLDELELEENDVPEEAAPPPDPELELEVELELAVELEGATTEAATDVANDIFKYVETVQPSNVHTPA